VVVALNAHDTLEQIGQVQQFCENLGTTYDIGLEQTETYTSLTQNFEGLNPFPLDIIVDRDGTIVHVTREYDPTALTQIIEQLLAQ
jgi:hypothetical protein